MKIKLMDYLETNKDTFMINRDKFKVNPDLEQMCNEQIKNLDDMIGLVHEEGLDLVKITV